MGKFTAEKEFWRHKLKKWTWSDWGKEILVARGFLNFCRRMLLKENAKVAFTFSQFALFNISGTSLRKESESHSSTNTRSWLRTISLNPKQSRCLATWLANIAGSVQLNKDSDQELKPYWGMEVGAGGWGRELNIPHPIIFWPNYPDSR